MSKFIFSNKKKTVLGALLFICLSFPAALSAQPAASSQSQTGIMPSGGMTIPNALFNSGTLNSFNSQFLPSTMKAQYDASSPQQQEQIRTAIYQAYLAEQAQNSSNQSSGSVQLPSSSSLENPDDDIFIYVPPRGQPLGGQFPSAGTPSPTPPGGFFGSWMSRVRNFVTGNAGSQTQATIGVCTPSLGIVPCDGTPQSPCNFTQLLCLAKNIINFLIVASTSLAVISFIYAGYLYLTAGGDMTKVKKAHQVFLMVLLGFIAVLSAWVLVNTIVNALLKGGYSFLG
ncbi:MAG: pilin [Patescibacteria group bacterium]